MQVFGNDKLTKGGPGGVLSRVRNSSVNRCKTETIRARVDAKLKADAEAVLDQLGLTASDAIRLFYRQVALRKGLPFDVKVPNAETRRAMNELDEGKDVTRYDDFDDFRTAMMGG
jgi:DNA-damage-inducible protein J